MSLHLFISNTGMTKKYPKPKKFIPKNPEKYVGDVNNIICRSGIELRYFKFFDESPAILKYASEEIVVPYINPIDGKQHRYFPDFIIKVKGSDGKIRNYMIEIKPTSDTIKPVKGRKRDKTFLNEAMTWEVNKAKWKYAEEFCKKHNMKFLVLTEKHIKRKFN